jgi:hypothetical protein
MLLLPVAFWIWLCQDWPARLGFFSDDWMVLLHPFFGSAEAFRDITNLVATRPASAPFIWLAQIFVDWDPARSQILNATMLLVTAASVGMLSAALSLVIRPLRNGAMELSVDPFDPLCARSQFHCPPRRTAIAFKRRRIARLASRAASCFYSLMQPLVGILATNLAFATNTPRLLQPNTFSPVR